MQIDKRVLTSMSTNSPANADRRRKAEAVRRDALEIGRRLLIEGGPNAITLKAIGAELGMSHANLIHHFGSADLFRARLRDSMVQDLTRTVTNLVAQHANGEADAATIVDKVFAAYRSGGIGMLMAWLALKDDAHATDELVQVIGELVTALQSLIEGPEPAARAREMVSLVTLLAFADSLIGKSLADVVGIPPHAMQKVTARIVDHLSHADTDKRKNG
jgi:TetR/AcrR family transcriptional regulator, repressor for neighboring sulfatase